MTPSTTPRRSTGHIEPLEARIAPATLLIGAQGLQESTNDTEYVDHNPGAREGKTATHADFGALNFVNIADGSVNGGAANPMDQIAKTLRGTAIDGTLLDAAPARYFYVHLHAGDSVVTYTGGGYNTPDPLISVTSGDAIAVFTDFLNVGNNENEYDPGEFTGLLLSAGAKVQINGSVNGDIVSALDTHKTLNQADDTLDLKGLGGPTQHIGNLKVLGGPVMGNVLSGGPIDNITLSGSVENVLVGTAANTVKFDFVKSADPNYANGRFTADVTYAPGTPGASISNGMFHDIVNRVEAGAGGFGAKGGSLTNITVNADTDSFALVAGHGGNADLASHVAVGGAGGSLTKINVQGTLDTTPNSVGSLAILVQGAVQTIDGAMLVAGDGGGSVPGDTAAHGGAGGSITGVTAGIVKGGIGNNLSADNFHLFGGLGGDGKTGGVGGSISSANVVVFTQDGPGNEIEVIAGAGGHGGAAGVTGGAAGAGGSLTSITASDTFYSLDPTVSTHSSTLVQAGDGGGTLDPSAAGAAGGSIRGLALVGFDSHVVAGSGSDGVSGGKGGSITALTYTANQTVIAHNLVVDAGHGGNGGKLAGGAGGAITGVKAPLVDLQSLYINTATLAGAGGGSLTGRGGAGGAVTDVGVADADASQLNTNFLSGDVQINGGAGGSGGAGGGAGGALNSVRVEGDHFQVAVQGGQGGDATIKGAGGAGGVVNVAFFKSTGSLSGFDPNGNPFPTDPTGSVTGGAGGAGVGAGGRGGAGGDLRSVSLANEGDGTLLAGSGGDGQATVGAVKGGAAGKGGSISASGLISLFGAGAIVAGDAGQGGAAPAAGGSILGSATSAVNGIRAQTDITIQAGNGSHGGAGGDISTIGYAASFNPAPPLDFAPTGRILVKAGDGSGEGAAAGRGGNISGLTAVASSLADGSVSTQITAGAGGGGAGVTRSGAGGSISHSTIATGGNVGSIIVIEAGNAGNSDAAAGGKGGSVTDIGFAALKTGTVIRSIAAGEGGTGTVTGGAGGSIDQIFAPNNDIGYRTGKTFGYATQGGLFAGVGGVGGKTGGTNGSVTNVIATAVSSIVAGARNNPIPHLAEKVANISLNGTNAQMLLGRNDIFVPNGDFTLNFEGQSTGLLTANTQASNADPSVVTVESALNALSTIKAVGGVNVQYTSSGGYKIQFNNPGAQPLIDAVEVVNRDVVETIPNSSVALPFMTDPASNGEVLLPNVATEPGVTPFSAVVTTPGSNLFRATEVTSGSINTGTNEVESIDVSSAGSVSGAQFTLSFLGDTTKPLFVGASAGTVELELNKLQQIQTVGGATVTQTGNSTYQITFNLPGREPLIVGQAFLQETEHLDLTPLHTSAASTYTLSFDGQTTAPIPINGSAFAIQTELNKLSSIQASNPNQTGAVTVNQTVVNGQAVPGMFDITFADNGFQSTITGAAAIQEIQNIHVVGAASDTFTIHSGDQVTPEFKIGATAEQVQVALNALPTIAGLGGVVVTKAGSDYFVKYNGVGAQTLLVPDLLQKEQQTVDLTQTTGSTTDYTIHSEYPVSVNETTPGQTIDIPFPDGNPYVRGQIVPGDPSPGNPTTRITVVSPGSGAAQEVDRLNFNQTASAAALHDGDLFILKYSDTVGPGASTENSIVIPYQSNMVALAKDVAAALNNMPLLKQGVSVVKDPNPQNPNQLIITYNAKSPQVLLQTETYTPTAHPGGYSLSDPTNPNSPISTTNNGGPNNAEVQTLDLDSVVARGGVFNLSFAGQTTAFIPTSNNVLTTDITSALNNLSTIGDFGGVNVQETSPGSHVFTITFQSFGDAPQLVGTAIVPESEQFNIQSITLDPTDEFTLSFRGDTTPVFTQGANLNATTIQNELNALPSIQALATTGPYKGTGHVRVFAAGPGTFRVDFPNYATYVAGPPIGNNGVGPDLVTPDLPNLLIESGGDASVLPANPGGPKVETHETQHLDLRSLTAYADGQFSLSFGGETTYKLPQSATAQDVQDALNSLFSIQQTRQDIDPLFPGGFDTGAVAVTKTADGQFDVTFNRFGQKAAITGTGTVNTDRFPIAVTQTMDGTPAIINIGEQVSGAYSSQSVIEVTKGTPSTHETQRIDLSTFNNAGLGDFTVGFGGSTSAPLTFTGAGVAPDAASVQAAINGLPTAPTGGVTVASAGNGVYDVTFSTQGSVTALLAVQGRHAEVQQIDLGSLYTTPTGEYSLSFGGQTTATFAHDATAAQISSELNNLPSVAAAGGVVVHESATNPERFSVTFGKLGDQPSLAASGGLTQETQRIDLGELVGHSDAQFKLTFNGETTGLLAANLSPSALAAEMQTALNALETINDTRTSAANPDHSVSAIGHVAVTAGVNGNFYVTFDARGDVPAISGYSVATTDRPIPVGTTAIGSTLAAAVQSVDGTKNTPEVQTIDLSGLGSTFPDFQLQFDNNAADAVSGYATGLLQAGATPAATAQSIASALNALPSIMAAGGVTVSVHPGVQTSFDVQFNSNGDQLPISAAIGQHQTQTLDVRALEQFHLTVDTTVQGDPNAGTQEHQVIDLTGVRTDFTLQLDGDRTISLPANATVTDIENALNALPSVMTAGGVTVASLANTPTANHRVEVTFNNTQDQKDITGTADSSDGVYRLGYNGHLTQALKVGLVDPNGQTPQSIVDLTNALNALPEIKALAPHDQGSVKVTLVNGSYQIEYNALGVQPVLTASGTFSHEPTVDLHRVTDGAANGAVPLPVFETTAGRAIGPVASTVTQGAVAADEVQTIDLTNEFGGGGGSGFVTINFNGDENGPLSVQGANPASDIQNYLNGLPSVQALAPNNTGSVSVSETAPGSHMFNVTFNEAGDQPSIHVDDSFNFFSLPVSEKTKGATNQMELQKLDLTNLPSSSFQVQFGGQSGTANLNGADQAANASLLQTALNNLGTIPGGVTVTSNGDAGTGANLGTFNITFNNNGDVAQIGASSFTTTETTMGGSNGGLAHEVQRIDVSTLQSATAAGDTFDLSYNGEVTTPLSRFATATDVQTALNALPQFSAAANNVTVAGSNGVFDVTFGDTVDHAGLIAAQAGNQEVQHLDTTSLQAQGSPSFTLTFGAQQTQPIAAGASANQVETALNLLPSVTQAGGVTVTQAFDAQHQPDGYDVKFNAFANEPTISGSVAVHEQLILDLHNLQNESGFITFTDGTNTSFPVPTNTDASGIQFAINNLSPNQTVVTQLHPGVFEISYQNAGSPPLLQAFVAKDGNSVRVPSNASSTEIESAIDNVSVSDTSLSGANGLYAINFADNGDQVQIAGTAHVHEQLRTDQYANEGTFHIVIGAEQTVDLPWNATADQIRLALNNLSGVQDLGGVKTVTLNPDSSFNVTFAGDYELPALQFVAKQNLLKDNMAELQHGDANTREVQSFSYTVQGAFDATKFANARLVGAIADFNEFDSNRFHFFDMLNTPGAHVNGAGVPVDGSNVPLPPTTASAANPFKEGDIPIDGIVMAKVIDSKTTNFIPEAALVGNPDKTAVDKTLFFDYLNGRA